MPSFNVFGGVTGRSSATLFEIRLDNEIIVLRGSENESSSQLLKGVVVLCLPSALKVEDVHLKMVGQLSVGWNDQRITPTGISNNRINKTSEIYSHKWPPFVGGGGLGSSSKGTTLPAGNYEWPFELIIPGSMAESVEGLPDSHIIYKLKASAVRGKLSANLNATKPVRIIRTLDPSALELAHAMTVENIWPNKIEYQIVIPQKAIIFGTAINIETRFTSLLKGLRIGTIKCLLIEQQEFTIPGASAHSERVFKNSRDVEEWKFELNDEDHYHDMLTESGQDGYTLNGAMPLPKNLAKCLQDVDVHGIKIRHKVKITVALHNPEGHVSELRATLPVTIFISPNMPLSADGCLVDQTPMSTQSSDISSHAPPLYGEHILDQLYADVDQAGIMTPTVQSGMNTPFYSQSRNGSSENIASLNSAVDQNGAVPPAALLNRLQNLHLNSSSRNSSFVRAHPGIGSGGNTPHSAPHSDIVSSYFEHHSNPQSTPLSRRTSEEDNNFSNLTSGQHSPEHIDYSELGDLNKVPSYSTAVRAPTRGMSYSAALPNYEAAMSAPPSPERTFSSPISPSVESPMIQRRIPLIARPIQAPPVAHIGDDDERRRLHFLRYRERAH